MVDAKVKARLLALIECPECGADYPYLSEHQICIERHQMCLACYFGPKGPKAGYVSMTQVIADPEMQSIAEEHRKREEVEGHRVFNCPNCQPMVETPDCPLCKGEKYLIGYSPEQLMEKLRDREKDS